MTTDTRTEAERRYDAERDGSLYVKPTDGTDVTDEFIAALAACRREHPSPWHARCGGQ